jgi:hypothetical protein
MSLPVVVVSRTKSDQVNTISPGSACTLCKSAVSPILLPTTDQLFRPTDESFLLSVALFLPGLEVDEVDMVSARKIPPATWSARRQALSRSVNTRGFARRAESTFQMFELHDV